MTALLKRISNAAHVSLTALGFRGCATQEQLRSVAHYIDPTTDEPFPYKLCQCGHSDTEHCHEVNRVAAGPMANSGPCRTPGCACPSYTFSHYGAETGPSNKTGGSKVK